MFVKNPKKRKRPGAQDWPPTSAQRKTLLPYTKRLKLPLLGEAPYKAVWVKIVSLALAEKRECCRKMKYFRDVHSQLRKAVPVRSQMFDMTPLCIIDGANDYFISYNAFGRSPCTQCVDLAWVSCYYGQNAERLSWVNVDKQKRLWTRPVTPFNQRNDLSSRPVLRHKDMESWRKYVTEVRSTFWPIYGTIKLDVIITAPKGVSRSAAISILRETCPLVVTN